MFLKYEQKSQHASNDNLSKSLLKSDHEFGVYQPPKPAIPCNIDQSLAHSGQYDHIAINPSVYFEENEHSKADTMIIHENAIDIDEEEDDEETSVDESGDSLFDEDFEELFLSLNE